MTGTLTLMKEPMCTHLIRVAGSANYYFRRKIPKDLVPHYQKAEIKKSLHTADRREAERRARQEGSRLDNEFASLRNATITHPPAPPPDAAVAESIDNPPSLATHSDWLRECNAIGKKISAQFTRPPTKGDISEFAQRLLLTLRARRELAAGTQFYEPFMADVRSNLAIREAILESGDTELFTTPGEPLWMSEAMRNGYVAFLNGQGAAAWMPPPTTNTLPIEKTKVVTAPNEQASLIAIADKWAEERKPNGKTIDMANRTVQRFRSLIGNMPVSAITRLNVVHFKDKLIELGQSAANTNKQLNVINTVLNYARDNAVIDNNPATGVSIKIAAKEKPRTSFDTKALSAIFNSPVFINGHRPKAGCGEASFWLPLLALFTGARLEELGQLHPSDVTQESYHDENQNHCLAWVIKIKNSDENGQALKNAGSNRRVPLHAQLLDLGFLEFALAAQTEKRNRLFHELTPDKYGTETAQYSKWFGRFLREVCKVENKRMTFHSFRHTFKELCRLEEIVVGDALTGHTSGNVGDKYGGDLYPLRPLVNGIKKFRVPGLDLTALKR